MTKASSPSGVLILAHHHPGRLRLRSESFRAGTPGEAGSPGASAFDRVRTAILREPGVRAVQRNETSGSVLVTYEPGVVDPNVLIDVIADAAGLGTPVTEHELHARGPRPAEAAIDFARGLDAVTRELTGGRADLRVLVPLALTGAAALSFVVKKDRMPHWTNLAYWAFAIFQSMHATEIATRPDRRTRPRPS